MRRYVLGALAPFAFSCAQSAFLLVSIDAPPGINAPAFDEIEVEVTALVEGTDVTKRVVFQNEDQRALPSSLVLEFPGNRNKFPITLSLTGIAAGVDVFSAQGDAVIGSEISLLAEFCGDGATQTSRGEGCDDANARNGDGCDSNCTVTACGNGIISPDEECEDGNTIDNDGCDTDCTGIDVIQLTAGGGHTCALLDIGTVRCWGDNQFGQLGYGNTSDIGDDELPFSAGDVPIGDTVAQISAGDDHTCALLTTGKVRCWGKGENGRLGYGNTNNVGDKTLPVDAGDIEIGGIVTQISAGAKHTCALLENGSVRCWGDNTFGQLGKGNTINIGEIQTPEEAGGVNIDDTVTQITAGNAHTCALLDSGNIRCWGANNFGQLGYGDTENIGDNEQPFSAGIVNVGADIIAIDAENHTCALFKNGNTRCWGLAFLGQLGYGNTSSIGDNEEPISVGFINTGIFVNQIQVGGGHTCATSESGDVRCWGSGSFGVLGYGNTFNIGDNEVPAAAGSINIGGSVTQIAVGLGHSCTLLNNGIVRCWGIGANGSLGYGNTNNIGDDETPASAGNVQILDP